LGPDLLASKPPGGGASSSLVAVVADNARPAAEAFLRSRGWAVEPIRLTGGLVGQALGPETAYFRAGHRVDLIGAADLGQDVVVRRPGVCVALTVGPLSELWVRRGSTTGRVPIAVVNSDPLLMADGLGL
jgi:hypothetical protein